MATIYVNKLGNDANTREQAMQDGTTAKLTINGALAVALPGDTIKVGSGVFYEKVPVGVSGEAGNPITIKGTYYSGLWQTIIDGSTAITGWTEDAAVGGAGCYRATPSEKAYWLGVLDDNGLHPIMRVATATYLDQASDATWCDYLYTYTIVNYWDGIDATWMGTGTPTGARLDAYTDGADPGYVWARFRGGDDPDTKSMYVSGYEPVVDLEGQSYIILKDLHIRGGQREINLVGVSDILIDRVRLSTGGWHIYIKNTANVTVQYCRIHTNRIDSDYTAGAWNRWYGATPTAPTAGSVRYIAGIKEKYYSALKSNEWGCYYQGYATNPYETTTENVNFKFMHNDVYDLDGTGLDLVSISSGEVRGNTFRNISGVGLLPYLNYQNVRVHENIFNDCGISIRFNEMDTDPGNLKQIYIYNNKSYLPNGLGGHIYWSWAVDNAPAGLHEQYIYHNAFLGGYGGWQMSYWAAATGLPDAYLFNNIVSVGDTSPSYWMKSSEGRVGYGVFGGVDYNWFGYLSPTEDPFDGANNIIDSVAGFWSETTLPETWSIPAESPALEAGIDVTSATLTINGTVIGAMPGFSSGYFTGTAPNMGAYNFGDLTAPSYSDISAVSTGSDSVLISWTPSEPASGWIEYGATDSYGSETAREYSYLSYHAQPISGLSPGGTIHYRIVGQDAAGNTGHSEDQVYTHASGALPKILHHFHRLMRIR